MFRSFYFHILLVKKYSYIILWMIATHVTSQNWKNKLLFQTLLNKVLLAPNFFFFIILGMQSLHF
jgi:hypothetical protein